MLNSFVYTLLKKNQMIKNSLIFISLLSIVVIFFGCKGSSTLEEFEVAFGYEYFPLEIGKYRTYVVDSTLYDISDSDSITKTQSRTFVKHVVADTLTDNLGRLAYKIERYERLSDTLQWQIKDIWTAIRTDEGAEWIEENLRFLKMVFPLKEGLDWDGNQYIDITTIVPIAGESVEVFKSWSYEVLSVDESDQIGDMVFDEVAHIAQASSENLIELRLSEEKYAKGIGLIYREMKILDTQCIIECDGQSWEDRAQKGYILKQEIIDYN
jgi:hypothetical protein